MSIESIEVVEGDIFRVVRLEILNKDELLQARASKVNERSNHQARVTALDADIADLDALLAKKLEYEQANP
jgi:hypothetical protein